MCSVGFDQHGRQVYTAAATILVREVLEGHQGRQGIYPASKGAGVGPHYCSTYRNVRYYEYQDYLVL